MRKLATAALILLPTTLAAQDERDVGRLAGLLESSLSSEVFQVQIDGLEGAFSSRAEIERLTILDATGPWMVIEGAVLDWNRAALLRGRVEVNELAADVIRIDRKPASAPKEEPSGAAAPGFAGFKLPELPVSVSLGSVNAPRIELSPEILGEALEASLVGSMALAEGDGGVDITLERIDIPGTRLRVAGGFTNSTQQLVVDVSAQARAGGTLSGLLGLPGAPSLDLSIAGAGSLTDFLAEMQLRTNEVLRVGGDIWIYSENPEAEQPRLKVRTNLDGDLRELVPPELSGFFGQTTSVLVSGQLGGGEPVEIEELEIEADTIKVDGGFTLSASGWPDRVALGLKIGREDETRVRLPVPDLPVYLSSTGLDFGYDASVSPDWKISGGLKGFEIGENSVDEISLTGSGQLIAPGEGTEASAAGELKLEVAGLGLANEGLVELLGNEPEIATEFTWSQGAPLTISGLQAVVNKLALTANAELSDLAGGIDLKGEASVALSDLSTAATLAGLPLEGTLEGHLSGTSTLLAGTVDATATLNGAELVTGSPELDKVIGSLAQVDLAVRRTEEGLYLDGLEVQTDQLSATASGQATPGDLDLRLDAGLRDLSVLAPGISGPLDLSGSVAATSGPYNLKLDLRGPEELTAAVAGELARDLKSGDLTSSGKLDLSILSAILEPRRLNGVLGFDLALDGPVAPTSIAGTLTLSGGAFEDPDLAVALDALEATAQFEGERVELKLAGNSDPDGDLALDATLQFLKEDPGQFLPYAIDYEVSAQDAGLVSRLARLPSKLALDLMLEGRGSADEVSANVNLSANGAEKLSGQVLLKTSESDSLSRDFHADLRADAEGVLPQSLVDLLGSDVRFATDGTLERDGAIKLAALDVKSEAIRVTGSGAISADRLAEMLVLDLDISHTDGSPVVLPIPDLDASIKRASIDLVFDPVAEGNWKLNATIEDTQALGNGVESLRLRSGGPVEGLSSTSGLPTMSGDVELTASGVVLENAQIGQFLTGDVAAGTRFALSEATGLALDSLFARSGVVDLKAEAKLSGLTGEDQLSAKAKLALRDSDTASPLRGALDISAAVEGDLSFGSLDIEIAGTSTDLGLGQQPLDTLLSGAGKLQAKVRKNGGDLEVETLTLSTAQLEIDAKGKIGADSSDLSAEAKLANLALLVPELPGPLAISADLSGQGGPISVTSRATGPAGITAEVDGTIEQGFGSANLTVRGGSRLEILTPFIRPATASGQILLDLALIGPFALPSISGQLTLSDGRVADPALSLAIEQLKGAISLRDSGAQIAISGNSSQGGGLSVDGQLALTGGLQASIATVLSRFQYVDPRLLTTSLDGTVRIDGPLAGGANISGRIDVGRTEVRLSTSLGGGGASVDGLRHVAEGASSRQTRKRAGLIEKEKKASGASKAPVYGLDVLIDASNPIFIRGLGLDAEVSGDVQIGGTTAAIEPVGSFELVRGRADILGQRLDLTEGTVILSGNSVPSVRFVATRSRSNFEVSAVIEGPLDDPDISFESRPPLPDDQVLSHLLFDADLGNLSGLQALQLANAVAVMRGGSGVSILGTIRDDLGIDNLDLGTDEDGNTNLKVGRYINETTYTDFEVRSDGNTAITLNIDLTPSLTVRGIAESDGSSGGGIFFERDF